MIEVHEAIIVSVPDTHIVTGAEPKHHGANCPGTEVVDHLFQAIDSHRTILRLEIYGLLIGGSLRRWHVVDKTCWHSPSSPNLVLCHFAFLRHCLQARYRCSRNPNFCFLVREQDALWSAKRTAHMSMYRIPKGESMISPS